jgi:hypothetical protein
MFEAFRLQIQYDRRTNTARCRVTLTGDTIDATARTATTAMRAGHTNHQKHEHHKNNENGDATAHTNGPSSPVFLVPPAGDPEHGDVGNRWSALVSG